MKLENFSKCELNVTLMRCTNQNKIYCEVPKINWLAIPNYSYTELFDENLFAIHIPN